MKIGFIGTGNMANAIIKGALYKNITSSKNIYVYDINKDVQRECVENYSVEPCDTIEVLMSKVDILVLAVKPNVYDKLLPNISHLIREKKPLVVSIAVGKSLENIEELLGFLPPLIRIMPNINATVASSISAFCCNEFVTLEQKSNVIECFSSIGKIIELDEQMFSAFAAIGSSAPAFCYLFIDSLARAAVKLGMNKKLALEIAATTALGSAKMILESNKHPWELIDLVCSPGGTTIEGLNVLLDNAFESSIIKAISATVSKDKAL